MEEITFNDLMEELKKGTGIINISLISDLNLFFGFKNLYINHYYDSEYNVLRLLTKDHKIIFNLEENSIFVIYKDTTNGYFIETKDNTNFRIW